MKQIFTKLKEEVEKLYKRGVEDGDYPAYVDEKGNCKFECVVNDSQIPGLGENTNPFLMGAGTLEWLEEMEK